MGIPSELRDMWIANKNTSLQIASPAEEQKMLRSSQCTAGNYYFFLIIFSLIVFANGSYKDLSQTYFKPVLIFLFMSMFQAYDLLHIHDILSIMHVNLFSKIFINHVIYIVWIKLVICF